jgi:hypothetical protein
MENSKKQKDILERVKKIGEGQSDANALVFNPKTGMFEVMPKSELQTENEDHEDPDVIPITEIAINGWA